MDTENTVQNSTAQEGEVAGETKKKKMDTNEPPLELVLRECKNKYYGLERNGKKYVGKNFIIVRAIKDTKLQSVCIELAELWEYSDFTIHDFVAINTIWLLSVDEYAKIRKFVDDWINWCEANNFSLDFST